MFFTVAYLKNSFSQSAMEKYRYTEWKALYSAEAGLNDVGISFLFFRPQFDYMNCSFFY